MSMTSIWHTLTIFPSPILRLSRNSRSQLRCTMLLSAAKEVARWRSVLKSGTKDLHGELYGAVRNDAFNANEWFRAHANEPRAKLIQNVVGGQASGPLPLLKGFWFANVQIVRGRNGSRYKRFQHQSYDCCCSDESGWQHVRRVAGGSVRTLAIPDRSGRCEDLKCAGAITMEELI